MKKKIKVALIGAGRIGMLLESDKKRIKPATHFGMWHSNKNVNFVAVCDKEKWKEKIIKRYNKKIAFFTDVKKMLKKTNPNIVSIATWKDTHYSICKMCIEHGIKTIVLEKPLANNLKQSRNIIKLIKKNKIKVLVNHRRRFDKEIIKLKKIIKQNKIGKIKQVSCFYGYGLLTTGTHVIDTLRMLLKDIAGEIISVIGIKNQNNDFTPKDDNNYDCILFFKSGLKVFMQSLNIKDYDIFDFYFYGDKAKILLTDIGRSAFKFKIKKSPEHTNFTELSNEPNKIFYGKPRNLFNELAKNAIECFNNKKKLPLCDEKDSHMDMRIIYSIIKSAKNSSKKINII